MGLAEFIEKQGGWPALALKLLMYAFFITVIISLILVLAQAYTLKTAYETGKGIEKECGDEFLERERGDYMVNEVYKNSVKSTFERVFKLLTGIVAFVTLAVIIIHIVNVGQILLNKEASNGDYFLSSLKALGLKSSGAFRLAAAIGLQGLLIALYIYILIIWLEATFSSATKFKTSALSISPYSVVNKSGLYGVQIATLATLFLITGVVVIPLINYRMSSLNEVPEQWKLGYNLAVLLLIILGVSAVVIPATSSAIIKIDQPIKDYQANYNSIVLPTTRNVGGVTSYDKEEEVALKRNIFNSHPKEEFPSDISTYTDLKSYVTHNVNYSDLQSIRIPEQLKPFIHHSSLKGEALLTLKRDLVTFYNDKNQQQYPLSGENYPNFSESGTSFTINGQTQTLYKRTDPLITVLLKHFTVSYRDSLLSNDNDAQNKRNDLLTAINDTIITNTSLEKANPFPSYVVSTLRKMRESTAIRDSVNSSYKLLSGLIFTLIAILIYFMIHKTYLSFTQTGLMTIALVIIILLAVGAIVGFITKGVWM